MHLGQRTRVLTHRQSLHRSGDLVRPIPARGSDDTSTGRACSRTTPCRKTYVRSQYHTSMRKGNMPKNLLASFILNRAVSGTRILQIKNRISFQFQAASSRSKGGLIDSANWCTRTISAPLRRLNNEPAVNSDATTDRSQSNVSMRRTARWAMLTCWLEDEAQCWDLFLRRHGASFREQMPV